MYMYTIVSAWYMYMYMYTIVSAWYMYMYMVGHVYCI